MSPDEVAAIRRYMDGAFAGVDALLFEHPMPCATGESPSPADEFAAIVGHECWSIRARFLSHSWHPTRSPEPLQTFLARHPAALLYNSEAPPPGEIITTATRA